MPTRNLLLAALGLIVVAASVGLACGPDFPWQLLDDRAATLTATPANSFAFEAADLAPAPADTLRAHEPGFDQPYDVTDDDRTKAETDGLDEAQSAAIGRMRGAPDETAAMTEAKGLPGAVALYTAGAVDYRLGLVAQAAARFADVLALPESERTSRAVWAAYMLGRIEAARGHTEAADKAFALTRALARAGAADPIGLAVASYGEQARMHLNLAHDLPLDPSYGKEIAAAVALYAQQAARGSQFAISSLRMVAEELLGLDDPPTDNAALPAAIGDPLTQRLLVAYALARIADDAPATEPLPLLVRLVAAIEASGNAHPAGADRLAALCYRIGRYDLAETLAAQADSALAIWVKAKLALHKGDLAAAAAQYALASRAFPDAKDAPLDDGNRVLLRGEQGVLTLARGDYLGALEQLYPLGATYWGDVAHIAERVLTVDELRHFVDTRVPEAPPNPDAADAPWSVVPATQLRALLARRLVQVGRYDDALPYFPALKYTPVRNWVRAYATAMHDATARWWAVDRAKAWYDAAVLANERGMDIMGTEGPPDYFVLDGDFNCCVGQAKLTGAYVTDGEKVRFAASAVTPERRYHYRYVALANASRAADLLPPRSQAFAAVLCQAAGFVVDRNVAAAQPPYRRYLNQGAFVPWAAHFGVDCPKPDFAEAARFPREQALRDARHIASRYRWPIGGAIVALLAAGAWLFRRRTGLA